MGQHRSVLEDVAGQAQQYKRATEQSLETVLAHSRAARLVYLTRVTQGKVSSAAHALVSGPCAYITQQGAAAGHGSYLTIYKY